MAATKSAGWLAGTHKGWKTDTLEPSVHGGLPTSEQLLRELWRLFAYCPKRDLTPAHIGTLQNQLNSLPTSELHDVICRLWRTALRDGWPLSDLEGFWQSWEFPLPMTESNATDIYCGR